MTKEENKNELKTNSLELNQKTLEKAGKVLATAKEEFSKKKAKRPAEELIRYYIKDIDELSKIGASLNQIYERLNKAVNLNITANSFAVYVRRVRKEIGSDLYTQRTTKNRNTKDKTEAAPEVLSETTDALVVVETWNCDECANAKQEAYKNTHVFVCQKCHIVYSADNNGKITMNRFSE